MGCCKNPTTNKKGTKQMSFVLILTFFTYIHGFTEVYVCIELLISQSSGQNLGFEFIDIQIENKAKPNHNSRKFAISTCLYPEIKKLKQHNAKILCFSNESEGSKINDIQTPNPYIREFRVPNTFKYTKHKINDIQTPKPYIRVPNTQNKKLQMKRKKEDNEV